MNQDIINEIALELNVKVNQVENALKLGNNLFINNIININKPYYQFWNYINQKFTTSNSKKFVKFDEHDYEKNDIFYLVGSSNAFSICCEYCIEYQFCVERRGERRIHLRRYE